MKKVFNLEVIGMALMVIVLVSMVALVVAGIVNSYNDSCTGPLTNHQAGVCEERARQEEEQNVNYD